MLRKACGKKYKVWSEGNKRAHYFADFLSVFPIGPEARVPFGVFTSLVAAIAAFFARTC